MKRQRCADSPSGGAVVRTAFPLDTSTAFPPTLLMDLDSLDDLYAIGLDELSVAMEEFTLSLPDVARAAKEPKLKELLAAQIERAREQMNGIRKLRSNCERVSEDDDLQCTPMEEMVCDCKKFADNQDIEPEVRDAGILAAVQSIQLWLVSKLGSVRAFAEDLGHHDASDALAEFVETEGRFNRDLTRLAEREINFNAADT